MKNLELEKSIEARKNKRLREMDAHSIDEEALLWELNKFNEYKVGGIPDPSWRIYANFRAFLKGKSELWDVEYEEPLVNEFLSNLGNNPLATAFAEKQISTHE